MHKTAYLTSLLLAASVCQAGGDQLLAAPSARPATGKSLKGTTATKATSSVADVVTAANAFIATLSTSQQTTLLQTFNQTNVAKWSNLPCGSRCRAGLQLSSLTTAQQTAGSSLHLQLTAPATTATYTLRNLLGQPLAHNSFQGRSTAVPTAGLAPGTYLLSVKMPIQQEVTSRVQVG